MRPWLIRAISVTACIYPICLIVILLVFRMVGERWWVTSVALYLPRFGWGLPLPLLVVLLLWSRQRKLLWTQLLALLIVWFGLMGYVVPWPVAKASGPTLRVFSYNVNSVAGGADAIEAEIDRFSPDVVFLEEVLYVADSPMVLALRRRYPLVDGSTQFIVASRYPIVETTLPPQLPYYGKLRSPRYVRYVIDTPLGKIVLYNLHPISPRESFYELRGKGIRHELASGHLIETDRAPAVQGNSGLRRLQVAAVAEAAAHEALPVVIVGDTNLPEHSQIFAQYLGGFTDGFRAAGRGFGYTFPRKLPWMRLDRILSNSRVRFVGFQVGSSRASDHLCVVGDLAAAR